MNCNHDGRRPYVYALGRRTTDLCSDCFARVTAIGMALTPVERRLEDVRPLVERRHAPVPRWLTNLAAKALDSWRVA